MDWLLKLLDVCTQSLGMQTATHRSPSTFPVSYANLSSSVRKRLTRRDKDRVIKGWELCPWCWQSKIYIILNFSLLFIFFYDNRYNSGTWRTFHWPTGSSGKAPRRPCPTLLHLQGKFVFNIPSIVIMITVRIYLKQMEVWDLLVLYLCWWSCWCKSFVIHAVCAMSVENLILDIFS